MPNHEAWRFMYTMFSHPSTRAKMWGRCDTRGRCRPCDDWQTGAPGAPDTGTCSILLRSLLEPQDMRLQRWLDSRILS